MDWPICKGCGYARTGPEGALLTTCPKCETPYAWTGTPLPAAFVRLQAQLAEEEAERKRVQQAERESYAAAQAVAQQQARDEVARQNQGRFNSICLTTTQVVPSREIARVLDVVSAECALGMNVIKDNITTVTDVLGGRSGTIQRALKQAKQVVMQELREEAYSINADAVVAVNLAYSEFTGVGRQMLFVVATGTAVTLKPETP